MATAENERLYEPMVVRTHVTPWGFLVALSLALTFAYLGAHALDGHIVPRRLGVMVEPPAWTFGALLLGFALFLFLIGFAELAHYLKPSIEVVVDSAGLTTYGVLGERRHQWADVLDLDIDPSQVSLRVRGRNRGASRDVRLHFSRLAVEPTDLVDCIRGHCPDLEAPDRTP